MKFRVEYSIYTEDNEQVAHDFYEVKAADETEARKLTARFITEEHPAYDERIYPSYVIHGVEEVDAA